MSSRSPCVERIGFQRRGACAPCRLDRGRDQRRGDTLAACRLGNYKAHFTTQVAYSQQPPENHETPLLFDLAVDPGERLNISAAHPEVLTKIAAAVAAHQASIEPAINQLQ